MAELLRAVRRRLRWSWAWATTQWAGPFVAVLALSLVVVGRLWPVAWPEPSALAVAVALPLVVLVAALVLRIPDLLAARAADRGLDTRDAFVIAVELDEASSNGNPELVERVRTRAAALAAGASARRAIPTPVAGRRLLGIGAIGLIAVALAWLPNPQDDRRAREAAEQAELDQTADRVEEAARDVEDPDVLEALQRAEEALREAGSLDEGLTALQEAQAALEAQVPSDHMATKAAAVGLDRSLETAPLSAGLSGSAEDQLSQLAQSLPETPEEQAALADRLEDLATTQSVGNPEASDALSQAAAAIAAGDLSTARAALGEAANAQADASAAVASADAANAASDALGDIASTAGNPGDGSSSGSGQSAGKPCPPQSDPQDEDDDGDRDEDGDVDNDDEPCVTGNGNGNGKGSGGNGGGSSGSQGGNGGGGASGNVAGASGGTGSGQGGVGQPAGTGGSGNDTNRGGEGEASTSDPRGSGGDALDVGGPSNQGRPGQTQGRGSGPTRFGNVTVAPALQDAYNAGSVARDHPELSQKVRDIISSFFDRSDD